jgi:hypothetical protein
MAGRKKGPPRGKYAANHTRDYQQEFGEREGKPGESAKGEELSAEINYSQNQAVS